MLIKQALALCFITCVIHVCVESAAEPKSRSRRNHRRCPNACLRKISKLEKSRGPPGPRGHPGKPGPQGQEASLKLPTCKSGEYLTSDGINLICEKLNLDGACSVLRKDCQFDRRNPSEGNTDTNTKVPGKMVRFMKKNMFQSISTDAWDIEVFNVDGGLYFGLSQLGRASFQIYKWYTNSFKVYQNSKAFKSIKYARNWSPFKIGDEQYFVVASYSGSSCPIFRYDKNDKQFKNFTAIECRETVDLKPFKLNGEQHIVVANHEARHPVVVWKWDGSSKFTKMQEIDITATYVEAFDVNGYAFIAITGSDVKGPIVFLYKWNGQKFLLFQSLLTVDRPYEMAAFEAGDEEFISVATMGTSSSSGVRNPNKLQILKWDGNKFQSFQNITSYGARRITAISSPLLGKETTYLSVINYFRKPEIYYWVGDSSTKFEKLQEIEATSARDVSFFEMGRNLYLLMSSRNHIDIFRGELV